MLPGLKQNNIFNVPKLYEDKKKLHYLFYNSAKSIVYWILQNVSLKKSSCLYPFYINMFHFELNFSFEI